MEKRPVNVEQCILLKVKVRQKTSLSCVVHSVFPSKDNKSFSSGRCSGLSVHMLDSPLGASWIKGGQHYPMINHYPTDKW